MLIVYSAYLIIPLLALYLGYVLSWCTGIDPVVFIVLSYYWQHRMFFYAGQWAIEERCIDSQNQ